MRLSQKAEQALDCLREHPYSTATEIADRLGTTRNHVSAILCGLRRRGLVDAVKTKNGLHRLVFVAAHPGVSTHAVLDRARRIEGPFAILAAQVMV